MPDAVPYGCPVCGFTSSNPEEVKKHQDEMANDPKHQDYDLAEQEKEDEE